MTISANDKIKPFNDCMPVLLARDDVRSWLHWEIQEVIKSRFNEPPPAVDFDVLLTNDRRQNATPPEKARGQTLRSGQAG